jgi:glycosyltransferase involved in cell wall biosynthesis
MRIAIDAVGIRGHGGAAVLCELLHWLPIVRPEWEWHAFLFDRKLREFDDPSVSERMKLEQIELLPDNGRQRLRWINRRLPARLRELGVDALFSLANLSPIQSVVPQVAFCHQPNAFWTTGVPFHKFYKRARLWFMRRQILLGARASRAVIVQTDGMRGQIEQIEPRLAGNIHVIPSGYRTPAAAPQVRATVRDAVESASHPRLIFISHPSEHKNHLALVRATFEIAVDEPNVQLLLTIDRDRTGDPRYSEFVQQIEREASRLGIAGRIVWLGCLTPDEVDFALRSADVMVFPSLTESFGLGLVEAMAAGCPVAAADRPYAHDVCGNAAVYFDPNDPGSIASTVSAVFRSNSESLRLKDAGLEKKTCFEYEAIADKVARVIETAALDYPAITEEERPCRKVTRQGRARQRKAAGRAR